MKKRTIHRMAAAFALVLLAAALFGCGRKAAEPAVSHVPEAAAETVLPGTWQTASMAYEADGTMHPEYDVRFTDTEIVYGHMRDGAFVFDHADKIVSLAESGDGVRVQAEASNGVRYSYQSCQSDKDVLEYFETWDENEFPEKYRGGASLSKSAS